MTITAILDTNLVISGIFWKGPPFEILTAWQKQRFHLVISPPILDEYRRVLAEMTERASPVLHSILELVEQPRWKAQTCSLAHSNEPLCVFTAAELEPTRKSYS